MTNSTEPGHMLNELSNTNLIEIMQACPIGMALSDNKQNISWVNDNFQSYLGITADEINGMNIKALPEILQPLFTSSSVVHIPANAVHDAQWYLCSQQTVNENTAHYITDVGPLHVLMQERDLLKEELREALAIDEVTGMPNKVALFQSLEPQISRSRRYNNLLSIIIMRVNNLEQLDASQSANLLIPISQMLNDQVRWADIVGRLSDSDFLLVLPETADDACIKLSNNLNDRLNELPVPEGLPANFKVSATFGHAEWSKGDDLMLLMQKARKMLEQN